METLFDLLSIEKEKKAARLLLSDTQKTFAVEGWVPRTCSEDMKKRIEEEFICHIEIREPGEDEQPPVLLSNPALVQPFEAVTQMYSLPSRSDIDPNPLIAPFFFLFFGIMMADAVYGTLMCIATAIAIKKWAPEGLSGKIVRLIFLGGISTIIWGVVFGSWFGDLPKVLSGGQFIIRPLWFNPMENAVLMLVFSLGLGVIHILTGLFARAAILIRNKDYAGAVFDVFSWVLLLIGLLMLIPGGVTGQVGQYMAIAGTGTILLFAGRKHKNPVKRILSGLAGLYSISGYLSDILSYARLLALGLATGVISSIINTMGAMFAKSVPGVLFFIFLLAFGTVFNIALNALGAFVHTSRLQYIEFFGKFYEGGGRAFVPFGGKTRYIRMNNN
ncbi:MAG TPA: hypothetical protein DD727_03475 [Clostridiales bacterium]|nr:hypothetical protein [Clostridiales bacterium]